MSRHAIDISTDADRKKAAHWCGKAPKGMRIEFRTPNRSTEQNRLLWSLLGEVEAHMTPLGRIHTQDMWKCMFMQACGQEVAMLPSLDRKTLIPYGQSSSSLTVKEMTDLIEFIMAWGAENGIQFKDPGAFSPSAQPVDGAEVSPPASAPSSITSEMRKHFSDFTRKGLSTIRDSRLSEGDTMAVILLMAQLYTEEFGEDVTPMLDKVMAAMKAVNEGKRTEEQAIEFISRELGCSADELKGRSK